jgi:hypothetical protein
MNSSRNFPGQMEQASVWHLSNFGTHIPSHLARDSRYSLHWNCCLLCCDFCCDFCLNCFGRAEPTPAPAQEFLPPSPIPSRPIYPEDSSPVHPPLIPTFTTTPSAHQNLRGTVVYVYERVCAYRIISFDVSIISQHSYAVLYKKRTTNNVQKNNDLTLTIHLGGKK